MINLQPFCAATYSGATCAIDKPWVADGYRYATDAKILVRIPATGEADTPLPDGMWRPRYLDMYCFDPHEPLGDWKPWPALPEDDEDIVNIESKPILLRYARQIANLPNAEYATLHNDWLRFRFDGGEGLVVYVNDIGEHGDIPNDKRSDEHGDAWEDDEDEDEDWEDEDEDEDEQ